MEESLLFDRQLGESIDMIVVALRAGYPIRMIFEKLGEVLPEPVAEMYQTLNKTVQTETDIIEQLERMKGQVQSAFLGDVIAVFTRHHNEGGSLANLLEPLAQEIIGQAGVDPDVREQDYLLRQSVQAA
jgi:Flp pilus assembly protein TadB